MRSPISKKTYSFQEFRFDTLAWKLFRRGEEINLKNQTLELLYVFVRNPGVPFSIEDLKADVWDGMAVTDWAVTTEIKQLRQALDPDGHVLLRNVRGRGYRFEAEVTDTESPEADPPPARSPGSDDTLPRHPVSLVAESLPRDPAFLFSLPDGLIVWSAILCLGLYFFVGVLPQFSLTGSWSALLLLLITFAHGIAVLYLGSSDGFAIVRAGGEISQLTRYVYSVAIFPFVFVRLILIQRWCVAGGDSGVGQVLASFALLEMVLIGTWSVSGKFGNASTYADPSSQRAVACLRYFRRPHLTRQIFTAAGAGVAATLVGFGLIPPIGGVCFYGLTLIINEACMGTWRHARDRYKAGLAA